ncbi:hypothetical protein DYB28_004147 [Aphanomyces astaci]|uniref:SBP-type domain-containing protein n=1 Tax=Aphanomyces astaci TaxID=112090 RepID=A0A9X8H3L8_APHAT|nr:hypothetical protein DYB28_004147 [Aphanomyces astaci]
MDQTSLVDTPNLRFPFLLRCQYVYKPCGNLRTLKKDGNVHKLCAFHRSRANIVQKNYALKRRQRLREQVAGGDSATSYTAPRKSRRTRPPSTQPIPFRSVDQEVSVVPTDVLVLTMLFSDETMPPFSPIPDSEVSSDDVNELRYLLQ